MASSYLETFLTYLLILPENTLAESHLPGTTMITGSAANRAAASSKVEK